MVVLSSLRFTTRNGRSPSSRPSKAASSSPATSSTLVTHAEVNDVEQKVFTATVTTTDPEAPAPTGSVSFFTTGDKDLRGVYPVVTVPDGSGGTTTGFLLGIAALDDAGVATLTLDQVPLGLHSVVAVYLGADAPITPQSTGDLPTLVARPTAKQLVATPTSPKRITNSLIVDTRGQHFRIAFGRIRRYDTPPDRPTTRSPPAAPSSARKSTRPTPAATRADRRRASMLTSPRRLPPRPTILSEKCV